MRRILILTTIMALGAGAAGTAQNLSPNETSRDAARRGQGVVTPQTGGENNTVAGRGADTNASDRPRATQPEWIDLPPIANPGSAPTLTAHQKACADRYRTYNPATDMYYARPGVQRRCGL
jgi:hypothetical protein